MSKTPSLASDLSVTLKIVQSEIKTLREKAAKVRAAIKVARANAKTEKTISRQAKKNVAAQKKAARIAKLEAKLIAMKSAPVGRLAIKAAKKPSKVTVTRMAA
jgi:hypothetical protein